VTPTARWDGHELRIIDWELALVADPAYDTASLLHRFTLNDTDTRHLMASALSEVPLKRRADYVTDVHAYRAQEEMRSKVFATIRSNLFTPPSSDDTKLRLGELARANEITGT
jgi:thiamine kinase-like enzyme